MISVPAHFPYPVILKHRTVADEAPYYEDEAVFDEHSALSINKARMEHVTSMNLDITSKRVLDVGGGPGHLAQYFVERGCAVTHTDARTINVERARQLYPSSDSRVVDVEDVIQMRALGTYDVVFSYGLLYHLESPMLALRHIVAACSELLLLETIVCDTTLPFMRLEDESISRNQALRGIATRMSPSAIVLALDRIGMPYVYAPVSPPGHIDFLFDWRNNGECAREGHNLRCIFVGSRSPLKNSTLISLLD